MSEFDLVIRSGIIMIMATDTTHCDIGVKNTEQNLHQTAEEAAKFAFGPPPRMVANYSAGVASGRIDFNRIGALTSPNPAKRFGLYPRKGGILIGGDADFVAWDPDRVTTIRNVDLHYKVEDTPDEGLSVRGRPQIAISRGDIIVSEGAAEAAPARGRWMVRQPSPPGARPAGILSHHISR